MSPLTYFTHLLGLWRVVLSADFKERKLIAVVVVHPFTEVVTDVESPAGSENGKETRARLWASAVPCFGLVIIKKIRFSHKQWLKSRSNPEVWFSLIRPSSIPECRFPHCYQEQDLPVRRGRQWPQLDPLLSLPERKSNNPQHVLFCCSSCACVIAHVPHRVTCSMLYMGGLKGARLKGAGRSREFWVTCSVSQKWATHKDREVQKHKHIVVFSSTSGHRRLSLAFILCALSSLPSSGYITAAVNISTD